MTAFILRRLLQAVPVLGGAILLTFILFHAVGGSPAAVVLGQQASPAALEAYERERGLDRPLFFGRWARTRALADQTFSPLAPTPDAWWAPVSHGAPGLVIPLRLPLEAGAAYRLMLEWQPAPNRSMRQQLDFDGAGQQALSVAAPAGATAGNLQAVRLRRRLAHPLQSQLTAYLVRLARGDLGRSALTGQSVTALLRAGIGPSLCLTLPIFFGGLLLAVWISLAAAHAHGRWPDRLLLLGCSALMSVNYVIWVIAGQYVLGFKLGWFPIWGFESWHYLLLPVLIGILVGLGPDVRYFRTLFLAEIHRDYVRTVYAKGAGPARVLGRHVLRNAALGIITHVSLSIPYLFTGSLLLESYFGIPGLGGVSVQALQAADHDVLRAVVLLGALLHILINL
ncbi:MAG: ABC transporter permease, partial [Candidatus Marinimicrobia bacterium]|nr:ABC transporter permease [Candidatus Neomarinimicrobiota bacterium]